MPAHRLAALLLAGCLLGSGCGDPAAGAAADPTGEWELVDLRRGGTVEAPPVDGRATLTVADGGLGGTSFCNSYTGTYRLDGDDLVVEGLGGTERACAPELMTAEASYLEALGAVERVGFRDGHLRLTGPDVELRFQPVAAVPASRLTATRWALVTLLDGEVAFSTTGEPAGLLLAADGTLTGSTGCRPVRGRWTLDGDVVRVARFAADGADCPPDVAGQDEQVTRVLSAAFRVAVAGSSLTATGSDGLGLVYRDAG